MKPAADYIHPLLPVSVSSLLILLPGLQAFAATATLDRAISAP